MIVATPSYTYAPQSERVISMSMAEQHCRTAETLAETDPIKASAHRRIARKWRARAEAGGLLLMGVR